MSLKVTVKWYSGMKGFGFIIGENCKEVFVHAQGGDSKSYLLIHLMIFQDASGMRFEFTFTI
ncbi:MAG TPA: hypothetical protein DSN98_08485 [Thermoplasmata archaeon]|nr:MAG TPA: hypothetical protein DSN98_08485 [Thermoplasmata archaeon]